MLFGRYGLKQHNNDPLGQGPIPTNTSHQFYLKSVFAKLDFMIEEFTDSNMYFLIG